MSGHDLRVSVIIPAHNAGHCLAACMAGVLAQTFRSWEAIIVDDGSSDDTAAVAARFASPQVRCVRQDNQGQGAARNSGLALARGEYVAFLDADDEWRPAFLERTVAFLDSHPAAVAVSTGFVVRFADGRQRIGPSIPGASRHEQVLDDFFEFWARYDHVRTGTVLIRHAVVQAAGPQRADLRISQDLEYWGYLATFGPWGFMPDPLWVGNSRLAAARAGWRRRYQQRRRLCPTVEAWEARIAPRLLPAQRPAFEVVRGRVAAGYAHAMVLAGAADRARQVVGAYGNAMPAATIPRLMRLGDRWGGLAWRLACALVRAREWLKAAGIERRVHSAHG